MLGMQASCVASPFTNDSIEVLSRNFRRPGVPPQFDAARTIQTGRRIAVIYWTAQISGLAGSVWLVCIVAPR